MQPNTRSPDCEQIRRGTQVACRIPAEAEHCFSLRGADFSSLSPQRSSEVCCGAAAQRPVCARESHHSRAHVFLWRALRFAPSAATRMSRAAHREQREVHAAIETPFRTRRQESGGARRSYLCASARRTQLVPVHSREQRPRSSARATTRSACEAHCQRWSTLIEGATLQCVRIPTGCMRREARA